MLGTICASGIQTPHVVTVISARSAVILSSARWPRSRPVLLDALVLSSRRQPRSQWSPMSPAGDSGSPGRPGVGGRIVARASGSARSATSNREQRIVGCVEYTRHARKMAKVTDIRDASAHQARFSLAGEVLRAVHAEPRITRAGLARRLEMSSGVAADTVRRLVASELLIEGPPIATGGRGRPTRSLGPHPHGPLVAVAAVAHESWEVAAVEVGGGVLERRERPHARDRARVLGEVALALRAVCERYRGRVRAIAISVPGTVSGARLVEASNLGWRDGDHLGLPPRRAAAPRSGERPAG